MKIYAKTNANKTRPPGQKEDHMTKKGTCDVCERIDWVTYSYPTGAYMVCDNCYDTQKKEYHCNRCGEDMPPVLAWEHKCEEET